jgi:hypothetical protein
MTQDNQAADTVLTLANELETMATTAEHCPIKAAAKWLRIQHNIIDRLALRGPTIDVLVKHILMSRREAADGDWACAECHPNSDMLVSGFQCGYHLAKKIAGNATDGLGDEEVGK